MTLPYTFTNGTLADADEVNANFALIENIVDQQLEQNINILINSAAISSTLNPYEDMFLDIFSDASGFDNTIDTTTTTSAFVTDHYELPTFVIIEATDATITWTSNNTKLSKISSGKWVLYGTSGTAEVQRANIHKSLWYGTDGTDQLIDDFTSVTAIKTTDTRDIGKQAHYLKVSGSYTGTYVSAGQSTGTFANTTTNTDCSSWSKVVGSDYTCSWEMPSGTDLNAVTGTNTVDELGTDKSADELDNPATSQGAITGYNGYQTGRVDSIILCVGDITWVDTTQNGSGSSITMTGTNRDFYTTNSIPLMTAVTGSDDTGFFVQTNAITITANPTGHQIYCHTTLGGTATVTYDISFDGGTTWVTDQELNTFNSSVHAGSSMKIKLNFNGGGSTNTIEVDDYACMLFY